jgi:hypothetical protein
MATTMRIIHARDCVRATAEGMLDRATSERLLVEVAAAAHGLIAFEVILDLTKAGCERSYIEPLHAETRPNVLGGRDGYPSCGPASRGQIP